jgi:thioredoxin 1
MTKPIKVEQGTFESEVLQSDTAVLVDFYADWCGPCRAVAPVVEELAAELDGKLKVAKLDVDQNEEISMKYGVQSIPTLILFQNGEEKERIVGFLPKPQLLSQIEPHIAAAASN